MWQEKHDTPGLDHVDPALGRSHFDRRFRSTRCAATVNEHVTLQSRWARWKITSPPGLVEGVAARTRPEMPKMFCRRCVGES